MRDEGLERRSALPTRRIWQTPMCLRRAASRPTARLVFAKVCHSSGGGSVIRSEDCQIDTENGINLTIFSKRLVKMTSFMVSY